MSAILFLFSVCSQLCHLLFLAFYKELEHFLEYHFDFSLVFPILCVTFLVVALGIMSYKQNLAQSTGVILSTVRVRGRKFTCPYVSLN